LFSLLFTEELRLPFDSLPLDSAALDFVEKVLDAGRGARGRRG